jgi:hypothetical protein
MFGRVITGSFTDSKSHVLLPEAAPDDRHGANHGRILTFGGTDPCQRKRFALDVSRGGLTRRRSFRGMDAHIRVGRSVGREST